MLLGRIKQINEVTIQGEFGNFPAQHSSNFDVAVDVLDSFSTYQKFLSIGYNDNGEKAECIPIENGVVSIPPSCFAGSGRIIVSLTFISGQTIINTNPIFHRVKEAPIVNNGEPPNRNTFYTLVHATVKEYVDSCTPSLKNLPEYVDSARGYANSAETANTQAQEKLSQARNLIPSGGVTGQVLTKTSTGSSWQTPAKPRQKTVYRETVTLRSNDWSQGQQTIYNSKIDNGNKVTVLPVATTLSADTESYFRYLKDLQEAGIFAFYQDTAVLIFAHLGKEPQTDLRVDLLIENE